MDKKKRNLIEEVESINSRSWYNSSHEFHTRMRNIELSLQELRTEGYKFKNELLRYIPIATIACFEGYFRSVVKEIVNFGEPFNENIKKLNQANNVKWDFEIISAIQSKTLSVGEFIGHILSFNNLNDINSALSILLNRPFLDEIKNFKKASVFDDVREQGIEFQKRSSEIIISIQRMYEYRHILCHEYATKFSIEEETIAKDFDNCNLFLAHTQSYIWNILYPNAPETQAEMNQVSYDEFLTVDKELERMIAAISENQFFIGFYEPLFLESIELWYKYREKNAEMASAGYHGGSMAPQIKYNELVFTTRQKIDNLKAIFFDLLPEEKS